MSGVGRDLCGSSSPTPLPKQGHLQQAAEDLVQAGLEYLQRRRLHNLPRQPVPVLHHPQREEVLPHVQTEIPCSSFAKVRWHAGRACDVIPLAIQEQQRDQAGPAPVLGRTAGGARLRQPCAAGAAPGPRLSPPRGCSRRTHQPPASPLRPLQLNG